MTSASPSVRDRIRAAAEEELRRSGLPMHDSDLAAAVIPRLQLVQTVSSKTVNASLHDDPEGRFQRVGRGTWVLRSSATVR